jgi:hypothetical protein
MPQMQIPTEEELKLVKSYIIYPIVLDVLERDMKIMRETKMKMTDIYALKFKSVMNAITHDAYEIRMQLKKHGIKIYEQTRTETKLDAKYLMRGYHFEFSMLWAIVKTEVQLMLCKYLEVDINDDKLR